MSNEYRSLDDLVKSKSKRNKTATEDISLPKRNDLENSVPFNDFITLPQDTDFYQMILQRVDKRIVRQRKRTSKAQYC